MDEGNNITTNQFRYIGSINNEESTERKDRCIYERYNNMTAKNFAVSDLLKI